jgi:hypothetical protein
LRLTCLSRQQLGYANRSGGPLIQEDARIEAHQVAQHKAASLTSTAPDLLTFPFDKREFFDRGA